MTLQLENPGILNDVMQAILGEVCECFGANIVGTAPTCFVSLTEPPADCCDYLALYLGDMQPTQDFPAPWGGMDQCGTTQRMTSMHLLLRRLCWPVVRDNPSAPFPPPPEIQAASETLLMEANALWCCLAAVLRSGDWHDLVGPGAGYRLSRMEPVRPRGGCAGVRLNFAVELENCC